MKFKLCIKYMYILGGKKLEEKYFVNENNNML